MNALPSPRLRLDDDLVPALDELAGTGRSQRDTVLLRLDLLGDADPHGARDDIASVRARGVDERERHLDHRFEVGHRDVLVRRVDLGHPVREVDARRPGR